MHTTHFVIMNNMNTVNTINQLNMIHHHNTTETLSNVMLTGWDVVILIIGTILLIWGGVKVFEWLCEKTFKMKDPWGCFISIVGLFSYITVGVIVIGLLVYLI